VGGVRPFVETRYERHGVPRTSFQGQLGADATGPGHRVAGATAGGSSTATFCTGRAPRPGWRTRPRPRVGARDFCIHFVALA